jgi:DNA-binding transcriptional LysR family regulator
VSARRTTKLSNLDLNLLVSLDALLRERSVTRAAAGLGLSQPTLSTALSRLRRHFDDELLVRVGNGYELTPLASDLVDRTVGALGVIERVFAGQPDFDPARTEREFTVVVSDYAATVLGPHLSSVLAEQAPGVCLRLQQLRTETVDAAPESLRAVDGIVLPHGYLAALPHTDLYDDQWACMVSADNESVGDTFTLEHLHTLPMVVTYREPTAFTPAVKQLTMVGIEPRVVGVSESFLALPFLVTGTDRYALIQQRLAHRLAAAADVRILPCPFPVTPLVEALWWHPVYDRDAGHQWIRTVFDQVRERLLAERS